MEPGKYRSAHTMNDPRITAYALGELTGTDRETFERELAESETLQRELAETVSLADALEQLPPSTDMLTSESRATLRSECAKNLAESHRQAQIMKFVRNTAALAASVAVLFGLGALVLNLGPNQKTLSAGIADPGAELGRVEVSALPAESAPNLPSPMVSVDSDRPGPSSPPSPPARLAASAASEVQAAQTILELNARIDAEITRQQAGGQGAVGSTVVMAQAAPTPTTGPAMSVQTMSEVRHITGGSDQAVTVVQGDRTRGSAALAKLTRAPGAKADEGFTLYRRAGEGSISRGAPQTDFNTESYDAIEENVFKPARENPLSTFSIDVDTASYANVRRFLQGDQLPPAGAIRTEELINYFSYAYPQPESGSPFSVNMEVSRAPWDAKRELVRIGLKGREIPASERGPANLVFLLDVSGSMEQPDKLPLLKRSLAALVENLSPKDRVAIVVYAGSSGLVLPSTPGTEKSRVLEALGNLKAGGSTNGGEGIRLAYRIARQHFLEEGNNRVILCTDGDFNVGTTSQSELVQLIEKERASGVFLSVLGFGTGNLKDSTMEKLADKGNGNYAYIDSITEGRKVLVEQMGATLFTIAKDVKIQVEFNPARVAGYRLIGYENRLLAKEDFNDDKKDAGEIGAGHTVTALYEIIPAGQPLPNGPSVDPLKYQAAENPKSEISNPHSSELLTLKLRYKAPDGDTSKLLEVPLAAPEIPDFEQASSDFQFAAAVAAFGMKLRGSPAAGELGWDGIKKIVRRNLGEDPGSYRAEFLTLLEKASRLSGSTKARQE
jgi:Ca-activated chloride channel family protein